MLYLPFNCFLMDWCLQFTYIYIVVLRGAVSVDENEVLSAWREHSDNLKDCFKSVVLPIGSLSVGLCKHRCLLFKVSCCSNFQFDWVNSSY